VSEKLRICGMNNDKMACTMLGAWLVELIFHERSEKLVNYRQSDNSSVPENKSSFLTQFLSSNVNTMDAKVIIKMLISHDVLASDCAVYASKSGDVATAVSAALSVGSMDAVSSDPFFLSIRVPIFLSIRVP
jgi:hypothetical protein